MTNNGSLIEELQSQGKEEQWLTPAEERIKWIYDGVVGNRAYANNPQIAPEVNLTGATQSPARLAA